MNKNLVNQIDGLLPQTQCGLCEYKDCRAYAQAIANNHERIDKCLPGGMDTLNALATLLQQDISPYIEDMQHKSKPASLAVIREEECIGCTKCIQACPVDAIIGAAKQMHTVIYDFCTGCELCIEPCPVDCIDILEIPNRSVEKNQQFAEQSRARYVWHQQRLLRDITEQRQQHLTAKNTAGSSHQTQQARQEMIAAAVARAQAKKKTP